MSNVKVTLNKDQVAAYMQSDSVSKLIRDKGEMILDKAMANSGRNFEGSFSIFKDRASYEISPVEIVDIVSNNKHKWLLKALGGK